VGSELAIPDAALTADIAILGKKGRGKSYAAKGLVERLLDLGERVLILDPLGHWWGLKASLDAEREGYPVAVFGGHHADIEIAEDSGRALAEILVSEPVPAIVDMGTMRKAEQQRLVADLLDELFARNRAPLTIVLEEADAFAPQSPMGDAVRVLSEVDRIARRGRAYGFRLLSITQRPAKLNKDVLTQLSVLIALGVTSPQDRDAIRAWVEGNGDRDKAKEVYETLAALPRGEGWVWAPDFDILQRVRFPAIKTLDTSATPAAGGKPVEAKRLAGADIVRLSALLQRCGDASGKSQQAAPPRAAATDLQAAEARGFERGKLAGEKLGRESAMREFEASIERTQGILSGAIGDLVAVTRSLGFQEATANPVIRTSALPQKVHKAPKELTARTPAPEAVAGLSAAAEEFLRTAVRIAPVLMSWGQLGVLCRRKAHGGSFNTARKQLTDLDYVVEVESLVQVRPAGFDYLGERPAPVAPTRGALIAQMIEALPVPAKDILTALAATSSPMTAEMLGTALGRVPRGGSWNTGMAILRNNGLIEETAAGFVLAALGERGVIAA
jgi:hypothetical protein